MWIALGNPLRFLLTGGQRHDIIQAEALIEDYEFERLIADRSYDDANFIQNILITKAEVVIPPRKNRKEQREYDRHWYKERHLVECSSTKSSIIVGSSRGLRSWPCDISAS
jgi:transposase